MRLDRSLVFALVLAFGLFRVPTVFAVKDFREAKRIASRLHAPRGLTLYCRCRYSGKVIDLPSCGLVPARDPARARRLEWEHVVPAEAFGLIFPEWRDGGPRCVSQGRKFRGRKCAETNPDFNRMEGDLYNLFPEDGEVNGLRSNYSMSEIGWLGRWAGLSFGGCKARVFESKFEPMDFAKGTVARAYLYMDGEYPGRGILFEKTRKQFLAWDAAHPVEPWECDLYREIRKVQRDDNPVLASRCSSVPR